MEVALWHPGGSLWVGSLRSVNLLSDILIHNEAPESKTKREKEKRGILTIFNDDMSLAT